MDTKQSVPGLVPEKEPLGQEPAEREPQAVATETLPVAAPEVVGAPEVPEALKPPEGPPDPEREVWEQKIRDQAVWRNKLLREAGNAGAFIPEWMHVLDNDAERVNRWTIAVLRHKGMGEEEAAERATEMAELEKSSLFHTLDEQLTAAFAEQKLPAETITRYSQEVRGALHEVIAGGRLKVADIERLLSGGIKIHATYKGDAKHYESVASIGRNEHNQLTLNLYRSFFARRKDENKQDTLYAHNDMAHLMCHELGHAISQQIFAERLVSELEKSILDAVDDANADLGEIPPEFRSIVLLLRDPLKAKGFEGRTKGHLANRFKALAEEKDPAKRLDFRRVMIREIIAERVANYLASDGSIESYTALRVNNDNTSTPYNPLSEQALFNAIKDGFDKKEGWQTEITEDGYEDYEDWFEDEYYLSEPEDMTLFAPNSTPSASSGTSSGESPLGKLWDFLTRGGEYKNKGVSGANIPEALKKAA